MDIKRKTPRQPARVDHLLIAEMVKPGARVLDVGCGDGELLSLLEAERDVDGRGIELSQSNVNLCVGKGLSVIQGDADRDLANYPEAAFDYAILSQTLQATRRPRRVLEQLLRIGRHAIVSFPNFGHWRIRLQFLASGRMPVTPTLPESWHETPNIHYCTIKDFLTLCEDMRVTVEKSVALNAYGTQIGKGLSLSISWQNIIGEQAVFLLTKDTPKE